MKARAYYDVICDYCYRALSDDVGAEPRSRSDAIRIARERGWRTVRGKNACPECVQTLRREGR